MARLLLFGLEISGCSRGSPDKLTVAESRRDWKYSVPMASIRRCYRFWMDSHPELNRNCDLIGWSDLGYPACSVLILRFDVIFEASKICTLKLYSSTE